VQGSTVSDLHVLGLVSGCPLVLVVLLLVVIQVKKVNLLAAWKPRQAHARIEEGV
jgi:hypothetical protein